MAKLKTGRHTSAIKELRKSIKRQKSNTTVSSRIKTLAKKVETLVKEKKKDDAVKLLPEIFSAWDKAAKTGVIHKNAAANQKARLSRMVGSVK